MELKGKVTNREAAIIRKFIESDALKRFKRRGYKDHGYTFLALMTLFS